MFLIIAYGIFGSILAIPYCWLAGGTIDHYVALMWLAPAVLVVSSIIASDIGVISDHSVFGERRHIAINFRAAFNTANPYGPYGLLFFWVWTISIFLPIILHWSAKLALWMAEYQIAAIIEEQRFKSPMYVLIVFILLIFGKVIAAEMWRKLKKIFNNKPPAA